MPYEKCKCLMCYKNVEIIREEFTERISIALGISGAPLLIRRSTIQVIEYFTGQRGNRVFDKLIGHGLIVVRSFDDQAAVA